MTHAQDDITQAFAAFFATLIAAIAQLAAEQPLLAPSLRMSIRQLEKLAAQIHSLVTEWQANRHRPHPTRASAIARRLPLAHIHSDIISRNIRAIAPRNPAAVSRAPPYPTHP